MEGLIVGFMPLRKGSKGIPGKNIAKLDGLHLFEWPLESMRQAFENHREGLQLVVAHDYGHLEPTFRYDAYIEFGRSAKSATDTAPTDAVIHEWLDTVPGISDSDVFLLTQATNPWTTAEDFKRAVEFLKLADDPDGYVIGAADCSPHIYDGLPPMFDRDARGNRQTSGYLYRENGSIYCTTFGALRRNGPHKGNLVGIVRMPEYTALEIDEPHHLVQARALCEHYQCTPPELRNFISDDLLL